MTSFCMILGTLAAIGAVFFVLKVIIDLLKKKGLRNLKWLLVCIVVFFACVILLPSNNEKDDTSLDNNSQENQTSLPQSGTEAETIQPTDEQSEPSESVPEVPTPIAPTEITLQEAVDAAIESAHAEKEKVTITPNFGSESSTDYGVEIYLKGSDNLSIKYIRLGMLTKASDILKKLQARSELAQVCMYWSFPLVDAFGNEEDETVMKILINRETLQKINFENFDCNNLGKIADEYVEHTALGTN